MIWAMEPIRSRQSQSQRKHDEELTYSKQNTLSLPSLVNYSDSLVLEHLIVLR